MGCVAIEKVCAVVSDIVLEIESESGLEKALLI